MREYILWGEDKWIASLNDKLQYLCLDVRIVAAYQDIADIIHNVHSLSELNAGNAKFRA